MKKILILTAGFGEGHNAAARNLRDAIELTSEDAKVEVLDLFESSYGVWNTMAKKAYLNVVRFAPSVWSGVYSFLDKSTYMNQRLGGFARLQDALSDILQQTQPDCVISTYPVYAHVIRELYREQAERPFTFMTVVTDSITVNAAWFSAPSDWFCVPNEPTAEVMRRAGVPTEKIKVLGFPVSPIFAEPSAELSAPKPGERWRILYLINTGKKKAGKMIDRLLERDDVELTITVGRDAELKAELAERTKAHAGRVNLLGWTNQMPQLMQRHHLIISKAGGATVQESIAARTPLLLNQVIPGQEEGNAHLVTQAGYGAVAEGKGEIIELVEKAFANRGWLWREWRANLDRDSRPDAALRLAEFVLEECERPDPSSKQVRLFDAAPERFVLGGTMSGGGHPPRALLCDLHTHTNYSDGKLTVSELVDFYGQRNFDCLCITDHIADPRRLIGKLARLSNLTVGENQLAEYFEVIEREKRRAWRKYSMVLMAGLEFNKDGLTRKSSAHLLGVDLAGPINPALDLRETIAQIHTQGGLAIASHPHIMRTEWGKNTLYLWENQEKYAPLLDAWEIANRNNLFSPVSAMRLPFVANSDFHKPSHIYSWKTMLYCEKDPAAIKACIRRNEQVSITLYRDGTGARIFSAPAESLPYAPSAQLAIG